MVTVSLQTQWGYHSTQRISLLETKLQISKPQIYYLQRRPVCSRSRCWAQNPAAATWASVWHEQQNHPPKEVGEAAEAPRSALDAAASVAVRKRRSRASPLCRWDAPLSHLRGLPHGNSPSSPSSLPEWSNASLPATTVYNCNSVYKIIDSPLNVTATGQPPHPH